MHYVRPYARNDVSGDGGAGDVDRRRLRRDLLQLRRVAAPDRVGGRVRAAVVARIGGERRLEGADVLIRVRVYRQERGRPSEILEPGVL